MSSVELLYYEADGYRVVTPREMFGRNAELQSGVAVSDGGYREVSASEFFGECSEAVTPVDGAAESISLTETSLFHSLVVVTFVAYLTMLLRSWKFIGSIWGGGLRNRSEHRMIAEGGELPLSRFKRMAAILGLVLFALVVVRIADVLLVDAPSFEHSSLMSYAPLVGLGLGVVVVAWFYAFHKVVGWLAQTDSMAELAAVGYINFVRMVVLLYPLLAVWLVAGKGESIVVSILLYILFGLLILLYLKDTFTLFLQKNISIFYWILYLCTAILLPCSFIARLFPEKFM